MGNTGKQRSKIPRGLADREAERRILLAVLYGELVDAGEVAPELFNALPPSLVRAALEVARDGDGADQLVQLSDRLEEASRLGDVGGRAGLARILLDAVPVVSREQAGVLLARLRDLHGRRAIWRGAGALIRAAVDDSVTLEALQAKAIALGISVPELVAAQEAKTSWTIAEVLEMDLQEPNWIVPELIPEGLTVLAGRPKAGKSFLALQLAIAVATGGRFLDEAVESGPVVYLALEDNPRRLRDRLIKMDSPKYAPVQFELAWPSLAGDGLDSFFQYVDRLGPRLVIVDTVARAYTGRIGASIDWNDQGQAVAMLAPLQSWALDRGLGVVAIDHTRKPRGFEANPIDDLLGSTGKAGVVDTILGLYRERLSGKGTLAIVGRDVEERELALQWDGLIWCWQLRGDAREVAASETDAETLAVLDEIGPADAGTVAREMGKTRPAARHALERLVAQGILIREKVSEGKTRKVRYSRPEEGEE